MISTRLYFMKPSLKFERIIENYLYFSPKGFKAFTAALFEMVNGKIFLRHTITKNLKK